MWIQSLRGRAAFQGRSHQGPRGGGPDTTENGEGSGVGVLEKVEGGWRGTAPGCGGFTAAGPSICGLRPLHTAPLRALRGAVVSESQPYSCDLFSFWP